MEEEEEEEAVAAVEEEEAWEDEEEEATSTCVWEEEVAADVWEEEEEAVTMDLGLGRERSDGGERWDPKDSFGRSSGNVRILYKFTYILLIKNYVQKVASKKIKINQVY